MATLVERVSLLAQRLGADIKALRSGKADDSAVVHITGAETINGRKTFGSAPAVPVGDLLSNPVRRDDGRLTDARTPLAHTHPVADVSGAEATANKSTASAKVPNGYVAADASGNVAPGSCYAASSSQWGLVRLGQGAGYAAEGTDPRFAQLADRGLLFEQDRSVYGDEMSPLPRWFCTAARAMAIGTGYVSGSMAAEDGSASKLRLFSSTAAAGSGSVQVAVYVGNDQTALTRVATASLTAVAASTMYELTLSATVSWLAGQWVYVEILPLGWSTCPTFQSSGNGGGPSGFLNAAAATRIAGTLASQSATVATLDVRTLSSAGTLNWFALTG